MRATWGAGAFVWSVMCLACGAPPSGDDGGGGVDAAPTRCSRHADCDDGQYCNGLEQCDPGADGADPFGCVAATAGPCAAGERCDEAVDGCAIGCDDADGDGREATSCGGDDCDDADRNRFPGNAEVCDALDHDEDCDARTFGARDVDLDSHVDALCCNVRADGARTCGDDCDDARASVHRTAAEICDGGDDDCDGAVDEGVMASFFPDADGDGYGAGAAVSACTRPPDHAETDDDCDDATRGIHPGAFDACDGAIDEDCSGTADDPPGGCTCTDGATQPCPMPGVCGAGVQLCVMGRWAGECTILPRLERCDGRDEDCDGMIDEGLRIACLVDRDDDSYAEAGAMTRDVCPDPDRGDVGFCPFVFTDRTPASTASIDCDDRRSGVRPGGTEICNGLDDDCNGTVDDASAAGCFADGDRDGYAPVGAMALPGCGSCPVGYTTRAPTSVATIDCDDTIATVFPGATEVCNRRDDNCDGLPATAEDADSDGHAPRLGAPCTGGLPADDCVDGDAEVFPGQTMFFSTPRSSVGGWDYDCSGADEREYGFGSCNAVPCVSSVARAGFCNGPGRIPLCGETGSFVNGCSSCSESCIGGVTQRCH